MAMSILTPITPHSRRGVCSLGGSEGVNHKGCLASHAIFGVLATWPEEPKQGGQGLHWSCAFSLGWEGTEGGMHPWTAPGRRAGPAGMLVRGRREPALGRGLISFSWPGAKGSQARDQACQLRICHCLGWGFSVRAWWAMVGPPLGCFLFL